MVKREIEGDKVTCLYDSSNILQTEYYLSKMILEVTFKTGLKYRYHAVTPMEHAGLQIEASAGQYLHRTIKPKKFDKLGAVNIAQLLTEIAKHKK